MYTKQGRQFAVKRFRKIFNGAKNDYEEDERDEVPEESRRRAWWSKVDIIRLCGWSGTWGMLRELLETEVGLICLRRGAPRGRPWTFATRRRDRENVALTQLKTSLGVAKRTATVVERQLAPIDKAYALTEESRDRMDYDLQSRYGVRLDQALKAITDVKTEAWIEEISALTDDKDPWDAQEDLLGDYEDKTGDT